MLKALIYCAIFSAVDGDTIKCDGELMRILGDGQPHVWGVDTAELRTYECLKEKELAQAAHRRMKELVAHPGVKIEDSGEVTEMANTRKLVRVWVPTDRGLMTAGAILMVEGLAREWRPGASVDWCD